MNTPWKAVITKTFLPRVLDANGGRVCEVEKDDALRWSEGNAYARSCNKRARLIAEAVNLVAQIARMAATGDTEFEGETLDKPYEQGPDDAMETIDSLITRARDILKGA